MKKNSLVKIAIIMLMIIAVIFDFFKIIIN